MKFHFLFLEFVIKETFMFCCQFIATCQACQYYYQRIQSSFDIATYIGNCSNFSKFLSCGIIMCTFCVNTTNSLPIKVNIFWEVNDKSTGRFRHIFVVFSEYIRFLIIFWNYAIFSWNHAHLWLRRMEVDTRFVSPLTCHHFIVFESINY